jgi:hypothetical protein
MVDWTHTRAHKISNERPNDWPQGVRGISREGLNLLWINEATGHAVLGRQPGQDAQYASAKYTGADRFRCSARCFWHGRLLLRAQVFHETGTGHGGWALGRCTGTAAGALGAGGLAKARRVRTAAERS